MINRRQVMQTAWNLFRKHYNFPRLPFKSIGRKCFAWCVGEAWRVEKIAAQKAAMSVAQIQARIAALSDELTLAQYRRWTPEASSTSRDIQIELNELAARIAA